MSKTIRITSIEEATTRLVDWVVEQGGIPNIPASADTLETDTGWAFFNVNGYLGTVTQDGDVVFEEEYLSE